MAISSGKSLSCPLPWDKLGGQCCHPKHFARMMLRSTLLVFATSVSTLFLQMNAKFAEIICVMGDSQPGGDGLPYSGWRRTGLPGVTALLEDYKEGVSPKVV